MVSQNSSMWAMLPNNVVPVHAAKDMSLNVAAGAYVVFTANVGGILIDLVNFYSNVAAAGLTSFHLDTTDTEARALLGSTARATASGGKNLTAYTTPFWLMAGATITLTTVGTGTGGDLIVSVRHMPSAGAFLS